MTPESKYIVGTSGYSFADWVGSFYPPGTRSGEMLDYYVKHFGVVVLNFSFYRLPAADTMFRMAKASPPGFGFWVKAFQDFTHKQDRSQCGAFLASMVPMRDAGKLAGVLMQFPQSFHRTAENRKYLASVLEDMSIVPAAVEFRHSSWDTAATLEGLRERNVTIVIPDVPDLPGLYRPAPAVTTTTGYLRLHSRNANKWHAGAALRYDYSYSREELNTIVDQWRDLARQVDHVYTFFNNCHGGQAAQNAEEFRKIVGQIQ